MGMNDIRTKTREALILDDLNGGYAGISPFLKQTLNGRLATDFKLNSKVFINSETTQATSGKVIAIEYPFILVASDYGQHLLYEHELTIK